MNEVQAFASTVAGHLGATAWSVLTSTLLATVLAFLVGLVLVIACGRAGLFRRSFTVWTVLAGINYVYLPLLFSGIGAAFGFLYGAQRAADDWIDTATQPIVTYAAAYLPYFQNFVNETLQTEPASGLSLEKLVERSTAVGEPGSFVRTAMYQVNLAIVEYAIGGLVLPAEAADAATTLRRLDITAMDGRVFELLPRMLHIVNTHYVVVKYSLVATFAIPFLLIPVAEYGLYRLLRPALSRKAVPPALPTPS